MGSEIKNIVIWGFHSKSCIQAINMLEEKKIIDVKAWIGNAPECTHDIISFYVGTFKKNKYHGSAQNIYDDIFSNSIYKFMDMMSRHSFYAEKSFYDLTNIFNLMFDFFAELLSMNDIDIVLFSDLPHEGADLVLYEIAKKLNIKTILCHQTIFPNKFFYVYDINDYARFNEIEPLNEEKYVKIENVHGKYINFYTSKRKETGVFSLQRKNSFGNLTVSILRNTFRTKNYYKIRLFSQKYFRHTNNNELLESSKQKIGFVDKYINSFTTIFVFIRDVCIRLRSFLKRFLQRYSNYKEAHKNLAKISTHKIDLNKKFVYFPLHLQPELTTSGLGGVYVDQVLAIEKLSTIIPEDWFIYVKENPKQTELMRGKWFFKRLSLIKNVKVISPDFDTYLLMSNSVFVATITGTAGWEAITDGKNVLVFGNAWYKTLPGVFTYDNSFKLKDILNYKIKHDDLERNFNLLLNKTAQGVIDPNYSAIVQNYNDLDNASNIETFLERMLK